MPQLQILERDASEGVKPFTSFTESFQKAQALTADMKYKKSLMDYNKELLKIKAKEATTEEEKLKYQHLKLKLEGVGKLTDIILRDAVDKNGNVDGKKAGEIFFGIAKDHPELAEALGGKDKDLSEWIPTGVPAGQQKEQAQAGKARAEAGYASEMETRLRGKRGLGPRQQDPGRMNAIAGQMPNMDISKVQMGEGGVPDVSQAVPQNQSGISAVGGQIPQQEQGLTTQETYGPGGITETVQYGKNRGAIAYQETVARKKAEVDAALIPLKNAKKGFEAIFAAAIQEIGELPETQAAAYVKGGGANVWSHIGTLPNVLALQRISKSFALQLASYMNRGRPSDKDFEAVAGLVMSLNLNRGTNEALNRYLNIILSGSDMYYDPSRQKMDKETGEFIEGEYGTYVSPTANKLFEALNDKRNKFGIVIKAGGLPDDSFIIEELPNE